MYSRLMSNNTRRKNIKKKKIITGMLSIALMTCVIQFPTVFAIGSIPLGNGTKINPDVNLDNAINNDDLSELRAILVEKSATESFDVNSDEKCNVKDLVALKKFLKTKYSEDNNFAAQDI